MCKQLTLTSIAVLLVVLVSVAPQCASAQPEHLAQVKSIHCVSEMARTEYADCAAVTFDRSTGLSNLVVGTLRDSTIDHPSYVRSGTDKWLNVESLVQTPSSHVLIWTSFDEDLGIASVFFSTRKKRSGIEQGSTSTVGKLANDVLQYGGWEEPKAFLSARTRDQAVQEVHVAGNMVYVLIDEMSSTFDSYLFTIDAHRGTIASKEEAPEGGYVQLATSSDSLFVGYVETLARVRTRAELEDGTDTNSLFLKSRPHGTDEWGEERAVLIAGRDAVHLPDLNVQDDGATFIFSRTYADKSCTVLHELRTWGDHMPHGAVSFPVVHRGELEGIISNKGYFFPHILPSESGVLVYERTTMSSFRSRFHFIKGSDIWSTDLVSMVPQSVFYRNRGKQKEIVYVREDGHIKAVPLERRSQNQYGACRTP
jgi:hypothetical protein